MALSNQNPNHNPKKILPPALFTLLIMGMGIAMPSCPGQQALQQQVDQLTTQNQDLKAKVTGLDNQVRSLTNDMIQVKTLLTQVSNTVLSQKTAIEQMDSAIKALQEAGSRSKGAAKAGAPKAGAAKKKR